MSHQFIHSTNIYQLIEIDHTSTTPKYLQIVNSVIKGVEEGLLHKQYPLPSINDLSYELEVSRDTGVRAYKDLKGMGIISSVPGKGYFIAQTEIPKRIKICLFFNKLSTHKKIIYDSFVSALGTRALIDFYIYNNDFALFKEILQTKKEGYAYYVIIPHFLDGGERAPEIIATIPTDKLILLDKLLPELKGNYGAVYEDFERDIYGALEQALEPLSKYQTLKIIFPHYTYHPKEILEGFSRFCHEYAFNHGVINNIARETIQEGTAYISLMEDDLVSLIERILNAGLSLGEQVGVLSYNETPLKRIIMNGITTISTDFKMMGEKAAQLILEKSTEHIAIPFRLTLRDSL